VELGLDRERPDRMQGPPLDRFAEHDVAGPDGKTRPDEVADQVAQRIESLVRPAELEDLVDAPKHGLRPFGAGTGIWICAAQILEEGFDAGLSVGENVETGAASDAPLLVGQPLQVRHTSEGGYGAEQFAGGDGDVQRQGIEQTGSDGPVD
jgi:hypothetical protein